MRRGEKTEGRKCLVPSESQPPPTSPQEGQRPLARNYSEGGNLGGKLERQLKTAVRRNCTRAESKREISTIS